MLDNYNTQEGSQWDGLAHVAHPRHGFYNGVTQDDIKSGAESRLSIHKWANKFVGRGTLVDAFKFRNDQGRPVDPLTKTIYSLDDLKGALTAQKTQLKPGGILLVHTGWMQAYLKAPAEQKKEMAPINSLKACGIEASGAMCEWLWDNRVAAIGTDCPSVESWPFEKSPLHIWALPLAGLPLGEQFELAPLANDCAQDGRYEFMVVSAPLNVEGGIASPPNAVAIK
jgi:kynurenine formamidase